jgi:CRP-like cAMP-binding protein
MGTASPVVDMTDLSLFSPLDRLGPAEVEKLLVHSRIERLPPGKRLFGIGDSDGRSLFLLAGQLALVSADNRIRMLKAATPEAGHAIAHSQPREATALARTAATVLSVDSGLLESLLDAPAPAPPPPANAADDTPAQALDREPADADLDLGPIFASPLFARLPAPNLHALMERMNIVAAKAGDVIVSEGEDSAWYHIIESGRFRLSRRHARGKRHDAIGELGRLDGFGEAALIANDRHDFSVTALADGRLVRFPKGDFLTLIVRPYIKWINRSDIATLTLKGGMLLDIRSHKAYARDHRRDSINLPLRVLRDAAAILDRSRSYIIISDNVRRSAAAAFLLAQQGMEASIFNQSARGARAGPYAPDPADGAAP